MIRFAAQGSRKIAHEEWVFTYGSNGSQAEMTLVMMASNVRMETSGPHADVALHVRNPEGKSIRLHGTDINLNRGEKHVWMANAAFRQGIGLIPSLSVGQFNASTIKLHLENFCLQLWEVWNGTLRSGMVEGDPATTPAIFLLKPYILAKAITFLYAQGGSGKSYLVQLMGLALDAAGEPNLELPWPIETAAHCVYVNMERSEESWKARLARVNGVAGLPASRPFRLIQARGKALPDVLDAIHYDVIHNGVRAILFDSVTRAGMGDLTKNDVANKIVDTLGAITEAGASFLGIGHTSWEGEHMYGAVQFLQGADLMVAVKSQQDHDGALTLKVEVDKGNDTGKGFAELFRMRFDRGGLNEFARVGRNDIPVELTTKTNMSVGQAVLAALSESGREEPLTAADITKRVKKDSISVQMELRRLVRDGMAAKVVDGKVTSYILRDEHNVEGL